MNVDDSIKHPLRGSLIIPSESGSRTEQASETGNPELAQGRATAAKKGEQSEERRQNIPEPTAKKENKKRPPGEQN